MRKERRPVINNDNPQFTWYCYFYTCFFDIRLINGFNVNFFLKFPFSAMVPSHGRLCAVCVHNHSHRHTLRGGTFTTCAFMPHSKNIKEALKQNVSRLISKAKRPLIREVFFGNESFLPPKYEWWVIRDKTDEPLMLNVNIWNTDVVLWH